MSWTKRIAGIVVAAAVVLTGLQFAGWAPPTRAAGTDLVSAQVGGTLPATDPASTAWDAATPITVPLSGQLVVVPGRSTPSTDSLEVRSLNNATHIAFRITWSDATKDNRTTGQLQFRDAVAVQLAPATGAPPICMGAAGARMHILQWKADWQADIEEGFRDLQDHFPNFWVDYYPYMMGQSPYTSPQNFSENAKLYLVGYQVGNPFSEPLKVSAVEDAVADGFSTITTQRQQDAIGRGVWSGGQWSVVITRPKDSGDGQDTPVGKDNVAAFAVWDGSSGDVGGRKSISAWVNLKVESPTGPVEVMWVLLLVLVVAVAVMAVRPLRNRQKRRLERAEEELPPEDLSPKEARK